MIIVAGEALIDLVPEADGRLRPLPGGSPFNVAIGLGRLGGTTGFLSTLSADAFGTLLTHRLAEAGVRVLPTVPHSRPTTLAMVHLDEEGHAEYAFYLEGTSATGMTTDDLEVAFDAEAAARSCALHVSLGAVTLASVGTGALLAHLLATASTRPFVSLDPNVRPAVMPDLDAERAAIAAAVTTVDLVKVSDADLEALYPGRDPLAIAGEWARSGPALVVVTRGALGATALRSDGGLLTVASLPVDVVDTVGAGDAFTSGLLAALDQRALLDRRLLRAATAEDLRDALAFAVRVAALTCTRAGADPPHRADVTDPEAPDAGAPDAGAPRPSGDDQA